jgi:hypothetical protein
LTPIERGNDNFQDFISLDTQNAFTYNQAAPKQVRIDLGGLEQYSWSCIVSYNLRVPAETRLAMA